MVPALIVLHAKIVSSFLIFLYEEKIQNQGQVGRYVGSVFKKINPWRQNP
jgi:hypothetical protein